MTVAAAALRRATRRVERSLTSGRHISRFGGVRCLSLADQNRAVLSHPKKEDLSAGGYHSFWKRHAASLSSEPVRVADPGILEEDSDAGEATDSDSNNTPTPLDLDLDELLQSLRHAESVATSAAESTEEEDEDVAACRTTSAKFERFLNQLCQRADPDELRDDLSQIAQDLLSAESVSIAVKVLISCHHTPKDLSKKVRRWERYLGRLKLTALTEELSFRLLVANSKSGNVGRVLSLLQLRAARNFIPSLEEYEHAVRTLRVANESQHKGGLRNVYLPDPNQPLVDNPTRWLDAILLNMSARRFPLTTPLAARMIAAYSVTGGPTGKMAHFFYHVVRQGITSIPPDDRPVNTDEMPKADYHNVETGKTEYQPVKVKVKYTKKLPPYYKVPSMVRGQLLYSKYFVNKKGKEVGRLSFETELEPTFSFSLAAAFAFADSLQHGACGHDPIVLDVECYNALIRASVHRGALWRAMHVLDTTMPDCGVTPNAKSYNHILRGLAFVGDVVMAQEYYLKMYNSGISPDEFTVRYIVDGLLNTTDVPGAITVVQDFFNQHSVLPPIWTHQKILELSLGQGMVYEAKRYVYFIQQLWKWEPNSYHSDEFVELMRKTQASPSLQKDALKKTFAYFGEELRDSDFLK